MKLILCLIFICLVIAKYTRKECKEAIQSFHRFIKEIEPKEYHTLHPYFPNSFGTVLNALYFAKYSKDTTLIMIQKIENFDVSIGGCIKDKITKSEKLVFMELFKNFLNFPRLPSAIQKKLMIFAYNLDPSDIGVKYVTGIYLRQMDEAKISTDLLLEVEKDDPDYRELQCELGMSIQAIGDSGPAIPHYERCLKNVTGDRKYQIMTNLGLGYFQIGERKKGLDITREVLKNNSSPNTYANLINLCIEEQLYGEANDLMNEAQRLYMNDPILDNSLVRLEIINSEYDKAQLTYDRIINRTDSNAVRLSALSMIPQVMESNEQIKMVRNNIEEKLTELENKPKQALSTTSTSVDFDNIFYLPYHGYDNDKDIIERFSNIYHDLFPEFNYTAPFIKENPNYLPMKELNRKIKIGFISSSFIIDHPHALLLSGIMRYLPRSLYDVHIFTFKNSIDLSSQVKNTNSTLHYLVGNLYPSLQLFNEIKLDILVFADIFSTKTVYNIAQTRVAQIQVLFWGNPVTSGLINMDFFITNELMECPDKILSHYTEQPIQLGGSGIWYEDIKPPSKIMSKTELGLKETDILFVCMQSSYKLHPDFDYVFKSILEKVPNSYILMIHARVNRSNEIIQNRIRNYLGPLLYKRVIVKERVSGQNPFIYLASAGDVALHPFPFDGSKTSLDMLIAGVPYVTLPTDYLRGRMGKVYYHIMELNELIANNVEDYITKSIKLALDKPYHDKIVKIIKRKLPLLTNRFEVVDEWNTFFLRIIGVQNIYNDTLIENTVDGYLIMNNYSLANQFINDGLMFLPSSPKLQFYKGLIHIVTSDRYNAEKRLLESLDLEHNYSRALTWYIAYLLHNELYDEFINYIQKLENKNSTTSIGYINILTVINYLNDIPTAYENILKYTPLNDVHRDFIPFILCFIQVDNYPSYFNLYYEHIKKTLLPSVYSNLDFNMIYNWFDKKPLLTNLLIGLLERIKKNLNCNYDFLHLPPPSILSNSISPPKQPSFHLIIYFDLLYNNKQSNEYSVAFEHNVKNQFISHIHVLTDNLYNFSTFEKYSEEHFGYNKIIQTILPHKPTYFDILQYMNNYTLINHQMQMIFITSQPDVYFDTSLGSIFGTDLNNTIYSLLPWQYKSQNVTTMEVKIDDFSAFVVAAPFSDLEKDMFKLKSMKCAEPGVIQAVLQYFENERKFRIINPSLQIIAHHLHLNQEALLYYNMNEKLKFTRYYKLSKINSTYLSQVVVKE